MSEGRRAAYWVSGLFLAVMIVLSFAQDAARDEVRSTSSPGFSAGTVRDSSVAGYPKSPARAKELGYAAGIAAVSHVVDGDTFMLVGGERVRVLGIDSCEMSTGAGADAKVNAELLLGSSVELASEPGVDRDPYGRLLRYVGVTQGDFAELMVAQRHTGVYQGVNDANPSRLAALQERDRDGRDCAASRPERSAPAVSIPEPTYEPSIESVPYEVDYPGPYRGDDDEDEYQEDGTGSGSNSSGYTGKRCYAPGGKVWRPC